MDKESPKEKEHLTTSKLYKAHAITYALVSVLFIVIILVLFLLDTNLTYLQTSAFRAFAVLCVVLFFIVALFTVYMWRESTSIGKTEELAEVGRMRLAKVVSIEPEILGLTKVTFEIGDDLFECYQSVGQQNIDIVRGFSRIPVFHSEGFAVVRQLELMQMIKEARQKTRQPTICERGSNAEKETTKIISNRCKYCYGKVVFDEKGNGECKYCSATFFREIESLGDTADGVVAKKQKFGKDATKSNYYTVFARKMLFLAGCFFLIAAAFLVSYIIVDDIGGKNVILVFSVIFSFLSFATFFIWFLHLRTKQKMLSTAEYGEGTIVEMRLKNDKVSIRFTYRGAQGLDYFGGRSFVEISESDVLLLRTFETIPIIFNSHASTTREYDLERLLKDARKATKKVDEKEDNKTSPHNRCPYCTSTINFGDGQEGLCEHCGTTFVRFVKKVKKLSNKCTYCGGSISASDCGSHSTCIYCGTTIFKKS